MNVKISRLNTGHYGKAGWRPAFLMAVCDGYRVRCTANGKGWDCACPDEECAHLNAVAAHIDPTVLAELEADSDHEYRVVRGGTAPSPVVPTPRRKRVEP